MSGPVQPPLTVETVDGATVGRPITKIKVTNGTLAVSGSTATLTISGGGGGSGTVTSVGLTETGTALTITGTNPVTTSGTINIAGAGTSSQVILGDLSLGTLTSGTVTSVGSSQAFISIATPTSTPSISIGNASGAATGVLTAANWSTFNGKQDSITLTTTGSSGAATLVGSTLNIPQYSGGGGTFSGSLADTQVAFGNTAADSIQGSSNLTFDGSNLSVSGYIKSGAGLVTAPAYTFTAADDVGMYLVGTNVLHFTVGSSDVMNLQHDGTATNVRLGNGTGGAALSSKGLTNLTLQTNDGVNSGTIVIEDDVNGQISITPNGSGKIKLDGVELDNTAIATGYILKASSATAAGWVAESAGGGNDFNAELVGVELDASGTGYAVFDILSSPPYGVARYTTGGVDTKQYFYPFIAPKSGSLSEIIVNLTAAAGSATNLYYGFYRDNNGVPDSMLGYATVDATSTGSISVTSFSATVTFTRGDQFWISQNKSTSQSITQRSIHNDYMPRIAPTEAFPSTTSGYYTSLATNSAVSSVPADITAEGLEGGVYVSGLGAKPHIGVKIL